MTTHQRPVSALMQRPSVRWNVERIKREERALLKLLLKATNGGLTEAPLA